MCKDSVPQFGKGFWTFYVHTIVTPKGQAFMGWVSVDLEGEVKGYCSDAIGKMKLAEADSYAARQAVLSGVHLRSKAVVCGIRQIAPTYPILEVPTVVVNRTENQMAVVLAERAAAGHGTGVVWRR